MEKIIEFELNGKKESATVRSWTAGDRNDILSACTDYDAKTDSAKINPFKFREHLVAKTLKSWSMKDAISMDVIRALPVEVFDAIANATQELNSVTIKEAKN